MNFPVFSLLFRISRAETGSQMTASTTKLLLQTEYSGHCAESLATPGTFDADVNGEHLPDPEGVELDSRDVAQTEAQATQKPA